MYIGQRQICQASPKSEGAARLLQAAADVLQETLKGARGWRI